MNSKRKIIYLCGFMASGKSTLGKVLANVLGWSFYDLDLEIENKEEKKIVEIFEKKGEEYFRKIETRTLHEISKKDFSVISLGGGTVIDEANLEFCLERGLLVYVKVSPNKIFNRLKRKLDRPLVKRFVIEGNRKELRKEIIKLLSEREKYYMQAHVVFEPKNMSFGQSIDVLANKIRGFIDEGN